MGNQHDLEVSIQYELDLARAEAIEQGLAEGLERGLAEGLERGLAEGLERGVAEGRAEANMDIARRMLAMGLDIQIIEQSTGLSAAEISKL